MEYFNVSQPHYFDFRDEQYTASSKRDHNPVNLQKVILKNCAVPAVICISYLCVFSVFTMYCKGQKITHNTYNSLTCNYNKFLN